MRRTLSFGSANRSLRFFYQRLAWVTAVAVIAVPSYGAAQENAPGDPVTVPGIEIAGIGKVDEVQGHFALPARPTGKLPAVLILHGSGGVTGRGAFYAKSLIDAGIATLEITMFPPEGRPRVPRMNIPHAAAALKWLAQHPQVDSERLGVMGFSWGGIISVLMPSEHVQGQLGADVPRPAAFVSFYPVCSSISRMFDNPKGNFYEANKGMRAVPFLIYVGSRDDTEDGERPCDALVAMWPAAAQKHAIVRNVEGATHGFDTQRSEAFHYVRPRDKRTVHVVPSPRDAIEARATVADFFVKTLRP